jgi:septal ring factor EnvC (AmiA/AmiB activator)
LRLARLAAALALLAPVLSVSPFPGGTVLAAGDRAAVDARRDALRARMERLRAELAETEDDRNEARGELRDSERAISRANRALRELDRRRDGAKAALGALAARKRQLEAEIAVRERDIGRVLAAIYVAGEPGFLKLLLSGQDPAQTARELHYLSYVSRAHAALVDALRVDLARVAELQGRASAATAELAGIEREHRTERDELLRQQAARRQVLQQISSRIEAQRREVKVLQADEARLARLVERIARALAPPAGGARNDVGPEPGGGPAFAGLKGRLRLPVPGTLVHRFGDARPEGGPPLKGLFIRAPRGVEIKAAAAGQVVFADWMRGYGNLLIVDHGAGYLTIYGNSESLLRSVGDQVGAGDPIGTVGASGGGQQTGLYFEARHEGKAFDPMTWVSVR